MKPGAKKILKWLGGAVVLFFLLCGLAIYTLVCFQRGNISRYSYCYFVCVSPEIKNVPMTGLVGSPEYASSLEMLYESTEYNAYKLVVFTSSQQEEKTINEIESYLSSIGFVKSHDETKEQPSRKKLFVLYKRNDSEIYVSISIKTAIDGYSGADTNYISVRQYYNYQEEKVE